MGRSGMKKLLLATLMLFCLGACAPADQADEDPPLAYCDLIADPAKYDGQVVRIRATHNAGWEWSVLMDETCADGSSHLSQTWALISTDEWCEGVQPVSTTLPWGYDGQRKQSLEREVIVVGVFHNSSGGLQSSFFMDVDCLESAGKWRLVD
jgi:hypothetical protein